MAHIYFAKMNINDDIYEVYERGDRLNELILKIANNLNVNDRITAEYGSELKFFNIDQSENLKEISGFLGDIREEDRSTYDEDTDSAITETVENALDYITFYFDVEREMLAFTVSVKLTKARVLSAFRELIFKSSDVGVEFIIETDMQSFMAEISELDKVRSIKFRLLPPNGDKEDFADLYQMDPSMLAETGATKFVQEYSTQRKVGVNVESPLIQGYIDGVGLGFAESEVKGYRPNGEPKEIRSEDQTPLSEIVSSDSAKSKSIIKDKAIKVFSDIMVRRNKIRIRRSK